MIHSFSPHWMVAEAYGASCSASMTAQVTHLVSLTTNTSKCTAARTQGTPVVSISWFLDSVWRWSRCDEKLYQLKDTPLDESFLRIPLPGIPALRRFQSNHHGRKRRKLTHDPHPNTNHNTNITTTTTTNNNNTSQTLPADSSHDRQAQENKNETKDNNEEVADVAEDEYDDDDEEEEAENGYGGEDDNDHRDDSSNGSDHSFLADIESTVHSSLADNQDEE
eukprot:c18471_g1_i4.p1 GENE.c18471_g1_i4~~c18471_g1_i4.p1  ORF type:complete len:222 (+),score=54.80 c18471_g1_i4:52-717(+)